MLHIHLFFTRVENESRLHKSAKCFHKYQAGSSSLVIALLTSIELRSPTPVDYLTVVPGFLFSSRSLHSVRAPFKQLLSLVNITFFFLQQFFCIVFLRPDIVSIHNPELLVFAPLLSLLKKLYGAKLIYEPHELEVCKTEVQRKPVRRFMIFLLENFLLSIFDVVVLVSDSIAEFYSDIYGISNLFVLPNIPLLLDTSNSLFGTSLYDKFSLKDHFSISRSIPVFIYQGLLSQSRGVRDLIDVFSSQTSSALVLMGYGPMEEEILVAKKKFSNLFFLPAVPPEYIVSVTASADFGLFYIPASLNPSRSYKYSMPNKFFEYLLSGLPIICSSNLKDVSSLVCRQSIGCIVQPDNPSLSSLISQICAHYPDSKDMYSTSIRKCSDSYSYQYLYNTLISRLVS